MSTRGKRPSGRTTSTVTVRLPAAAYQRLMLQAQRSGKGVSTYAKQLVMWGIAREPKQSRMEDQDS